MHRRRITLYAEVPGEQAKPGVGLTAAKSHGSAGKLSSIKPSGLNSPAGAQKVCTASNSPKVIPIMPAPRSVPIGGQWRTPGGSLHRRELHSLRPARTGRAARRT